MHPGLPSPPFLNREKAGYTAAITAMIGTVPVSRVSGVFEPRLCKAAADKNLGIGAELGNS